MIIVRLSLLNILSLEVIEFCWMLEYNSRENYWMTESKYSASDKMLTGPECIWYETSLSQGKLNIVI